LAPHATQLRIVEHWRDDPFIKTWLSIETVLRCMILYDGDELCGVEMWAPDLVPIECRHRLSEILISLLSALIDKASFRLLCAHAERCGDRGVVLTTCELLLTLSKAAPRVMAAGKHFAPRLLP
jgi:hypothetical protein